MGTSRGDGRDVAIPWRRVAAAPAAATWIFSGDARRRYCWCRPLAQKCDSKRGWDGYVGGLADAYYRYDDDWAFSFPGRLARCAVPIFESNCLNMKTPIMSHECNFRLARTGPVLTADPRRSRGRAGVAGRGAGEDS